MTEADKLSPSSECLFCGGDVESDGQCSECRWCFVMTPAGPKISADEWNMAFGARDPNVTYRDPLTRAVQDALVGYYGGKEIPHARLRKLVGLLIDLHCHQEGIIAGQASALRNFAHQRLTIPSYPPPRYPDPVRPTPNPRRRNPNDLRRNPSKPRG